jgi:hypothetical protein
MLVGMWLAYGCAAKGVDMASDFDMPVRVSAGDDATIITLGRLSGGGIGCLLLSALMLWRAWRVARKALDRTVCGIENYDDTRNAKRWIQSKAMCSTRPGVDAPERAIRRCLKRMKT